MRSLGAPALGKSLSANSRTPASSLEPTLIALLWSPWGISKYTHHYTSLWCSTLNYVSGAPIRPVGNILLKSAHSDIGCLTKQDLRSKPRPVPLPSGTSPMSTFRMNLADGRGRSRLPSDSMRCTGFTISQRNCRQRTLQRRCDGGSIEIGIPLSVVMTLPPSSVSNVPFESTIGLPSSVMLPCRSRASRMS